MLATSVTSIGSTLGLKQDLFLLEQGPPIHDLLHLRKQVRHHRDARRGRDGAPEEGLGWDRGVGVDHVALRRAAGVPLVEKRAACSTAAF